MKKNDRRKSVARKFTRRSYGETPAREISSGRDMRPAIAPKDLGEARKEIARTVCEASVRIVNRLIELAETGEVTPAKYLFEMVGLYPVVEETNSKPENSLAYTLLQRMGLPTDDKEEQSRWGDSELTGGNI
jgi:hypothetical protein